MVDVVELSRGTGVGEASGPAGARVTTAMCSGTSLEVSPGLGGRMVVVSV